MQDLNIQSTQQTLNLEILDEQELDTVIGGTNNMIDLIHAHVIDVFS